MKTIKKSILSLLLVAAVTGTAISVKADAANVKYFSPKNVGTSSVKCIMKKNSITIKGNWTLSNNKDTWWKNKGGHTKKYSSKSLKISSSCKVNEYEGDSAHRYTYKGYWKYRCRGKATNLTEVAPVRIKLKSNKVVEVNTYN